MTKNGDLVTVPADAGMPCQACFENERELKFRYYRRVLGLLIMDQIWGEAGYFCAGCRRVRFARNMAFTLVLGWWGLFALFFRNPYAILVNVWALFAPPFPAELGAMNASDIRRATEDAERDQRLADVYMRMPEWIESLSEDDLRRVLAPVDYYAVLGVDDTASHAEIKGAWRAQAKASHPDRIGPEGHERMVAIGDAWEVLGDERLRHAFDHREEVLDFLDEADAVEYTDHAGKPENPLLFACVECRLGFETFDDAADHVDAVHPHTDYVDILVSLAEDDSEEEADGTIDPSGRWRCKACAATFEEYDEALGHADRAHPERVSVDSSDRGGGRMSRHCEACGHASRPGDRFCVRCGHGINANAEPSPGQAFRASDHRQRRRGAFVLRHVRGLMALGAVGVVAALIALGGSSSDSLESAADDAAPAAAVAAEARKTPPERKSDRAADKPSRPPVAARGADGKRYLCSYGVLDRINAAKTRVKRRERILRGQRRELAKLDREYPNRAAPPDVADHYNALLARARAQLKWTNGAIGAYNHLLVDLCERD